MRAGDTGVEVDRDEALTGREGFSGLDEAPDTVEAPEPVEASEPVEAPETGEDAPDPRLAEFLDLPSRYVHPSWFEELEHGEVLAGLRDVARVERPLSRLLSRALGLGEAAPGDTAGLDLGVHLLGPAALETLVERLGLSLASPQVRAVLDGPSARALREALGEEGYAFAVGHAALLVDDAALRNVPRLDPEAPRESVRSLGMAALALYCVDYPAALNARLGLKLPRPWSRRRSLPALLLEGGTLRPLVLRLVREQSGVRG